MAKANLKGTQTEKNIVSSYLNESQSYARYTFYAKQADKENYFPVGEIFRETADNELHHAKVFLKMLGGGSVVGTVNVDALPPTTTEENLMVSMGEEEVGGVQAYHEYAKIAKQEGFPEIAAMYRNISIAEKGHEERYRAFIRNIETASVFAKEGEVVWQCRNCGFIYTGKEAPEVCPACLHPQAYFEVKKSNY